MARIAGVDVPDGKQVWIALQRLYGVGPTNSRQMLSRAGIEPHIKVKDLTEEQLSRIREALDRTIKTEGELRREVSVNIRRLIEIGTYRGLRHQRNLPTRGQRTRTNARIKRGPRKTVAGRGHKRGGVGRK